MRPSLVLLAVVLCSLGLAREKSYSVKPKHTHHAKGFRPTLRIELKKSLKDVAIVIPNSMDLRGKISPIRDQGQCGSCYAFGTISSLRDALMIQGKDPGELSPQYLMDYSKNGCNGGYFDVMDLTKKPKGAPLESLYPYRAMDEAAHTFKPVGSEVTWAMLGGDSVTPRDIEVYMSQYGFPVPVSMSAGAGDFEGYNGGVYNGCVFSSPDHIVAVVGFDNENGHFNSQGFLPPGVGYWIVRNSWGTSWGEKGFFRIKMTDSKGRKCNSFGEEAAGFFFTKRHG